VSRTNEQSAPHAGVYSVTVTYRELLKRTPIGPVLTTANQAIRRKIDLRAAQLHVDGFVVKIPRRDVPRYREGFEPLTLTWVRDIVGPSMTVVDIGAALGMFTLHLASLVGPSGEVIAIEPAPRNAKLLAWNVRRNHADVDIRRFAAASANCVRDFMLTDSSDSHGFYPHPLISPSRSIKVPSLRLDSVISHADFIKIDVEGAEIEVLDGATRLLDARPPLVVEWVPACQEAAGHTVQELPDWLRRKGYSYEVFDELGHVRTTVEYAFEAYSRGALPPNWYANLCCQSI
jgi:FkbM family methyltransferase